MAKRPTLDAVNARIKRWQTKFTRTVNELAKLRAQKIRLEKAAKKKTATTPHAPVTMIAIAGDAAPFVPVPHAAPIAFADLDVPDFLRRTSARLDEAEAEVIKAEVEAKRLAKARGRIAKMKAQKSGDTKKMPLSGRAALDKIRNG